MKSTNTLFERIYKLRICHSISSPSCPFELNIKPKYFVRPMYYKTLLSNVTLGQNNLLFLGLNETHTDFTGLNIMSLHYTKVKTYI